MRCVRRVEVNRRTFHASQHMCDFTRCNARGTDAGDDDFALTTAQLRHQRLPDRFSQMLPQTRQGIAIELEYAAGLRPGSYSCVLLHQLAVFHMILIHLVEYPIFAIVVLLNAISLRGNRFTNPAHR